MGDGRGRGGSARHGPGSPSPYYPNTLVISPITYHPSLRITPWTPGGSGSLSGPEGIAVYQDGDNRSHVYITDTSSRVSMYRYSGNGSSGLAFVKRVGSQGAGRGTFNRPTGLAVDSRGNLWVADRVNDRVQILDRNLKFISRFTAGFNQPTGTAISPNGKFLYVVDASNARIQRFRLTS